MPTRSRTDQDEPSPISARRVVWRALPHLCFAVLALLFGSQASAQFTQYVEPGSLANAPADLKERLEQGAAEARWRFGPVRVDPLLFIRELGYQDNVFGATDQEEKVSDYRALVAAGLNGYLPVGRKAMLAGFVTPEYSWWADRKDLEEFNLSTGVGFFGFFNRLTLSVDGRRLEQERPLNADLTAPVKIDEERVTFGAEVELARSLSLFAALRASEFRHSGAAALILDDLRLMELDRDYTSERAGVRLRMGEALSIGLGVEESDNDFFVDPGKRSNQGTSPFVEARLEGHRFEGRLELLETELEFAEDALVTDTRSTTGTGRLTWRSPAELSATLYASRNVVFSAREVDTLFLDERLGLSVGLEERRIHWLLFVETGELDFRGVAIAENGERVDDLSAYGVDVGFDLTTDLALVLTWEETSFDSSLPAFDRSSRGFGLRLVLRDNLFPF